MQDGVIECADSETKTRFELLPRKSGEITVTSTGKNRFSAFLSLGDERRAVNLQDGVIAHADYEFETRFELRP